LDDSQPVVYEDSYEESLPFWMFFQFIYIIACFLNVFYDTTALV
jgi:hypothetical protein